MKKHIQGIAIFLIALVLTLPIYSSSVLAALSNPRIYGTDNVQGFYRKGEPVTVEVDARIADDPLITPSQVHVIDSSGPAFTSCIANSDGSFHCTHILNSADTRIFKDNPAQIRLVLYGDNGANQGSLQVEGISDELAPEIKSFSITPSLAKSGNVFFTFEAVDHSYSLTDNKCSGMNRVELSYNNIPFKTQVFNYSANQCKASNTITLPVEQIAAASGLIPVILTAYDNFNQPVSTSAQFTYDITPPMVSLNSLQITNSEGNSIDHIRDYPITADIIFSIIPDITDDLDRSKVFVDISGANTDYPQGYKVRAQCGAQANGINQCFIRNTQIKVQPGNHGDLIIIPITVEAYDKAGNMIPASLSKILFYDSQGPVVAGITTDKAAGSTSYLGEYTTFIVEMQEDSRIIPSSIKLDLSSISGSSSKPADRCENDGTWKCYWENIRYTGGDGEKTIQVLSSSKDILGNLVTGELSKNVIVDKTPPVLISSALTSIATGENVPELSGLIKTTDTVKITVKLREKSGFRAAYADFSPIVTQNSNVSTSGCLSNNDGTFTCTFESSQIDVPGFIATSIRLTFVDTVGNTLSYNQPITVYEYSSALNPSYWSHAVSCSPSLVDRQVTSLVQYRIMCSVNLIPLTGNQETISMELGQCVDNIKGSTAYIQAPELLNKERGSTNPYLNIKLSKTKTRIDEISVDCPISIRTLAANSITKYPEVENVTVKIRFYNMPLGEFDTSIEEKIKDVEDEIGVGWEWISTFKKFLFYAEKLCSIVDLLNKLMEFWGILESALSWVPAVNSGTAAVSSTTEKSGSSITNIFYELCKYISCDKTLWGNWYNGQKSLWYNDIKTPGRGFAQGGDKEVGAYENWLSKYDLGSMWPENPKDSIVLSIATGCIPGIIYGIEKWRQVQCNYGVCLWDSAENNVPISTCDEQKSYLECKFLFGEIFQLIPLNWLRELLQQITYILSDPLSLVFGFLGMFCPDTPGPVHGGCAILKGATLIGQIADDFQMMFDSSQWKIQGDMCKEYFDRLDELEGGEIQS